jgi:hypothetical protein
MIFTEHKFLSGGKPKGRLCDVRFPGLGMLNAFSNSPHCIERIRLKDGNVHRLLKLMQKSK